MWESRLYRDKTDQVFSEVSSSVVDKISLLIMLNMMRAKSLTWAEIYGLTGYTPSQLIPKFSLSGALVHTSAGTANTNDYTMQKGVTTEIIDPLWIFTQSFKNYSTPYHGISLTKTVLTQYSDPSTFELQADNYGMYNRLSRLHTQPLWLVLGDNKDWMLKQLFALRYSRLMYATPGVAEIRLVSSAMMRISKPMSDIDIMIKTKPKYVYSTRLWVKFFVLKLFRRDVHLLWVEIIKRISFFIYTTFSFQSDLVRRQWDIIRLWAQVRIEKHKFGTQRQKLDIGVIFSDQHIVDKDYVITDPRQQLWLGEYGTLCSTIDQCKQAIVRGDKHIMFQHAPERVRIVTYLSDIVIRSLVWFVWVVTYPLNVFQYIYYYFTQDTSQNYSITADSIGFVPRIYKEGYFTRIPHHLDKN